MKQWLLYKENNEYDLTSEELSFFDFRLLLSQRIVRPLFFHEVLKAVSDRERRRRDLKICVDEISYCNELTAEKARIYTDKAKCYLEARTLENPLVMLLYRLGKVVYFTGDKIEN